MKPISEAWCCQIEITNACNKKCAHCSRAVRHVAKPYFMSLQEIDDALTSLKGFPGVVGCMGGEPTLHPEFDVICHLYSQHFPRDKCGLWTSGHRFNEYRALIRNTFGILLYNDHSETGKHQPWMIAMDECVPDEETRLDLIENCWVQEKWSPSINPKGAFFCEFAAVFDLLFDGPGGYPVKPDWWRKNPKDFQDQVSRYCCMCSAPLPFPKVENDFEYEYVSKGNATRLLESRSPWAVNDKLRIVPVQYTRECLIKVIEERGYKPWDYLGDRRIRHKDGDIKPGYARDREHTPLHHS